MADISGNIKKFRKIKKFSQGKLAEILKENFDTEIAQNTISQYESGTREPNLDTLQKIAEALDVPMYQLLGMNEQEARSGASLNSFIGDIEEYKNDPDAMPDHIALAILKEYERNYNSQRNKLEAIYTLFEECYLNDPDYKKYRDIISLNAVEVLLKDRFLLSALKHEMESVIESRLDYFQKRLFDEEDTFSEIKRLETVKFFEGSYIHRDGEARGNIGFYTLGKKDTDINYTKFLVFEKIKFLLENMKPEIFSDFMAELNYFVEHPGETGYFKESEIIENR